MLKHSVCFYFLTNFRWLPTSEPLRECILWWSLSTALYFSLLTSEVAHLVTRPLALKLPSNCSAPPPPRPAIQCRAEPIAIPSHPSSFPQSTGALTQMPSIGFVAFQRVGASPSRNAPSVGPNLVTQRMPPASYGRFSPLLPLQLEWGRGRTQVGMLSGHRCTGHNSI